MPTGRPSEFTLEIAEAICAELMDGKSLKEICSAEDMPGRATVYQWLLRHEVFADMYARAREIQADTLADEIVEISDDGRNDYMENNDPENPGYRVNGEHVQRSRLRVDSRKWYAAKLNKRKYGDKIEQEISGAGGGPLVVTWQTPAAS